jgi:hypothetical protein
MRSFRCYLPDAKYPVELADVIECIAGVGTGRPDRKTVALDADHRRFKIWDRERDADRYQTDQASPSDTSGTRLATRQ